MKINKKIEGKFNPYSQGRVELKKKKMKEGLDNKFSDEFYQKANAKRMKKKGMGTVEGEEEFEESEGQLLYEKQREYYLKMLGEDKINQLEDLTNLEVQKEFENQNKIEDKHDIDNNIHPQNENIPPNIENIPQEIPSNNEIQINSLPLNYQTQEKHIPVNPLKKKENPALLPPNSELLKTNNNNIISCVNHSQLPINSQERDPRNYQGLPPCMLSSIIPAGKPSSVRPPLNLFSEE